MPDLSFNDDGANRILRRLDNATYNNLVRYVGGGDSPVVAKSEPYYSKFRVEWTLTAGVWTLPVFAIQAFSYGKSESMASAGFTTSPPTAGLGDTNIQTKGETNNGEVMLIQSVGVVFDPDTDPVLLKKTIGNLALSAGFGGDDQAYKWGPMLFYPGGATLTGGGTSPLQAPNLGDAAAIIPGFPGLGFPAVANTRELQETITWFPKGGGTAEQNFSVTIRNTRSKSFTPPAARSAATGIAAVTIPTTTGSEGSYVEGWIKLDGFQVAPRTKNR